MEQGRVLLDHGGGGEAAHRLIREVFLSRFTAPEGTVRDDDAALLDEIRGPLAFSTDGYIIDPVEFAGGDIGSLAVHGTVNDVAMLGAVPLYLSCAFILEEGLPFPLLERLAQSMADAASAAGVRIVTGDTKVAPRGTADKIFITTAGIGRVIADPAPSGTRAAPGDAVLLSGCVGDHGLALTALRGGLHALSDIRSDSAPLNRMVEALVREAGDLHVLRDPTRGGLAATLNEIARRSAVVCLVREADVPVRDSVAAGCSVLGLDPLYLANEGKLVCILPQNRAEAALNAMRRFPEGRDAACIGEIAPSGADGKTGQVILHTRLGGRRLLSMPEGEQLPRIC
ncbi:MAG: hydrogenase expression/formation protein HypE [Desulfovibrio sp.]|jgi:hydrogenase expression/formation protein HypE|nr:hydrogenase expression/formation protein HypE [Desulfovibrio sp.]